MRRRWNEVYEREALSFSYTDPTQERGHLEASRTFVREDCEDTAFADLAAEGRPAGADAGARWSRASFRVSWVQTNLVATCTALLMGASLVVGRGVLRR